MANEYVVDLSKLTWADMPLLFEGIRPDNAREYCEMMTRAVGMDATDIPLADIKRLQQALLDAVVSAPKD